MQKHQCPPSSIPAMKPAWLLPTATIVLCWPFGAMIRPRVVPPGSPLDERVPHANTSPPVRGTGTWGSDPHDAGLKRSL